MACPIVFAQSMFINGSIRMDDKPKDWARHVEGRLF
jgi:hypothetical protein